MTIDEFIDSLDPVVGSGVKTIIEIAGTHDADHAILKAAGELLAALAEDIEQGTSDYLAMVDYADSLSMRNDRLKQSNAKMAQEIYTLKTLVERFIYDFEGDFCWSGEIVDDPQWVR